MSDINRQKICADALDKMYPRIYELDSLAVLIGEIFFSTSNEGFKQDKIAQRYFTANYDTIGNLVSIMGDIIEDVRLLSEYALGLETDLIKKDIELTQEKVSWLENADEGLHKEDSVDG